MHYDCSHLWFFRLSTVPQLSYNVRMFVFIRAIPFGCLHHYFEDFLQIQFSSSLSTPSAKMIITLANRFSFILVCLYVIHFNLFIKSRQTMAEDKNETRPLVIYECPPIDLTVDSSWLETVVFGNFRIWHIMFSGMAIFTGITVVLCCLFRCRIPRTKQEIEADFLRKKICESFNNHLKKIKIDELQSQYDQANLLPLLKKVEMFEEDRVQKNEGFEKCKLTWKQKLKRLFSGKDSMEEYGDKSIDESRDHSDAEYKKMTVEEMETVEKEVEGAKTDSSALNMINDQIAIFGFLGESKKDRKKRLKEQKKAEKALKKEQKMKEKLEKKLAKQPGGVMSARSKSAKALLELRPESLEKDHSWNEIAKINGGGGGGHENGGESITIDIEDRSDDVQGELKEVFPTMEAEPTADSVDKGYQEFSLPIPIPDKEETSHSKKSFASRFSFRDTVNKLINFRSKPKQKEELVINIELVKKEDDSASPTPVPTPPPIMTTISIPQIECSPPEYEDNEQQQQFEQQQQLHGHHKTRKSKMIKKDSVITKDDSLDRNLLQIPEISKSTKEVNSERRGELTKPLSTNKEDKHKRKEKESKSKEKKEKKTKEKEEGILEKEKIKMHKEKPVKIKDNECEKMKKSHKKESKTEKKSKEEKVKKDSTKRALLKRQTGGEDGHAEKLHKPGKIEKETEKTKSKEENIIDSSKYKALAEPHKSKDKEKNKEAKLEEVEHIYAEVKRPKEAKSSKSFKTNHEHKEEKLQSKELEVNQDSKKKEKGKVKHLEFDDKNIEQTSGTIKKQKEKSKCKESDRRLETFPMVVEEVKSRQRKLKKEWDLDNEHASSPKNHAKEHCVKSKEKLAHRDSDLVKDQYHRIESPKAHKQHSPKQHVTMSPVHQVMTKKKDFSQVGISLNEELKQEIDRRKNRLKHSKTIDEDVIMPIEDQELRARVRDDFKKRLSEVLQTSLQRMSVESDMAAMGQQQVASVAIMQRTSSKSMDGTSSELIAAKSRQIRVITKQATSSSEIEIPVEHVYTRGLTCVQVHPSSSSDDNAQVALVRHPTMVVGTAMTSILPPSPTLSHASTVSVVTDNIVKKLIEASPETGENRELTYECSRDIIFSLDQQEQQQQRQHGPASTSMAESGRHRVAKSVERQSPTSSETSGHHRSASASARTQKNDKPHEKKHKGRHN